MKNYKFWFCTGSQDLYGDECLRKVAEHSAKIVEGLNNGGKLPFEVVLKPTLISQASTAAEPDSEGFLLHGVYAYAEGKGVDEPDLWGDYFYMEALCRVCDPDWTPYW